jgi:hypothetical protein
MLRNVMDNSLPFLAVPLSALLIMGSTSLSLTGPEELEPGES